MYGLEPFSSRRPSFAQITSHRVRDRLGANRRVKSHRTAGCCGDAHTVATIAIFTRTPRRDPPTATD
jgi:hypothetical protein